MHNFGNCLITFMLVLKIMTTENPVENNKESVISTQSVSSNNFNNNIELISFSEIGSDDNSQNNEFKDNTGEDIEPSGCTECCYCALECFLCTLGP